jgi:putative colanic acid biosynthesis acetyltransferase WcaF
MLAINKTTDLSQYNNDWYRPGAGVVKRSLWFMVNAILFKSSLWPCSGVKVHVLKWFGARVGRGVNIKPSVSIKYPWRLSLGAYVWIGEDAWIDNLADVQIGDHVCISQGAMLLTGNHDFKKSTFDLLTRPIALEDGVWIGAQSVVCPGVTCKSHSVLSVGSVATKDLEGFTIYQGNPAQPVRKRHIS